MLAGITSTIFGTGTQNVRRVDFWHILAFLENNPDKFSYVNKVQSLSFSMISISILH